MLTWAKSPETITTNKLTDQFREELFVPWVVEVAPMWVYGGIGAWLGSNGGARTGGDGSMVKGTAGGVMM